MDRTDRILSWTAGIFLVLFAALLFSDNRADVDLWGNLGFVKTLPGQPGFHTVNTYSFTAPDNPWINHEWLAEYLFDRTNHHTGTTGLLALKTLLGFILLFAMMAGQRPSMRGPGAWIFLLLIISNLGYGFGMRPHLLTFLFAAGYLQVLCRVSRLRGIHALTLALATGLWANVHGAFFIGTLLILAALLQELAVCAIRRQSPFRSSRAGWLTAALVAGIALTRLNPYGWDLWKFIGESAGFFRPYLSEWAPFNPRTDFVTHPDFIALALVVGAAAWRYRRHISGTSHVALALSFLAACLMVRNIPLFALTAGMVAWPAVRPLVEGPLDSIRRVIPRPVQLAVLLLMLIPIGWTFHHRPVPHRIIVEPGRYPVALIRWMHDQPLRGNLLTFFDWGELAIWHLYPQYRVFIDGRLDCCYPPGVIRDYVDFLYATDPQRASAALNQYPTDLVLIHVENPGFLRMRNRPDWILVAISYPGALFAKQSVHAAWLSSLHPEPSLPIHIPPPTRPVLFP